MLQGDAGYSRKSERGQASYYYSQPFFKAAGRITIDDKPVEVTGQAWMDREWSSQPLASDQTGWDWFSLHLNSGEKLMLFRLRQTDGHNYVSGNWISPDGKTATDRIRRHRDDADKLDGDRGTQASDRRGDIAIPTLALKIECCPAECEELDGNELSLLGRADQLQGQPRRRWISGDDRVLKRRRVIPGREANLRCAIAHRGIYEIPGSPLRGAPE